MFTTLPWFDTKAPNIVQTQPSQEEMTKLGEDRNVMMRPVSLPVLTTTYENRSLVESAAGGAKLTLGVKRPKSERKGTMDV